MDHLDYVEQRTARTLEVLRKSYDDLHERAYKFATVLVAGGGAAGAYALGKFSPVVAPITWAPLAALALSWFGVAAYLMWCGTTSRELSPGNGPENMLSQYDQWNTYLTSVQTVALQEQIDKLALERTRKDELALEQRRLTAYSEGCVYRADAIDAAYKLAAICSPLVPAVVAAFCLSR